MPTGYKIDSISKATRLELYCGKTHTTLRLPISSCKANPVFDHKIDTRFKIQRVLRMGGMLDVINDKTIVNNSEKPLSGNCSPYLFTLTQYLVSIC